MDRNAPIGVFDSGIGGLTVAREIMRQMPQERIVYFGDTARVPYGSKSQETVLRYSRQIIRFLKTQGVKAIVIACNTASACALETVRQELDIPIIGVIAELAQPVQVIGVEERQARKPVIFVVLQRQMPHGIDLFTNGVCVDTEQVVATAAEFRRDMNVIVMVENGLLHMQFVGICIQQRVQNRGSELCHGAQ